MITLEVDGTPFANFTNFSVTRSIENFSGEFSFTATDTDGTPFPIKAGSRVKAAVNNTAILDGWVEVVSPSVDSASHAVSIQGRDVTADLVDSTLSASSVELNAPISLESVIKQVLSSLGLDIPVINNVDGLADFNEADLISAKAGQNAFEFVEKFARKRQVLLTTNGKGSIVITRGDGQGQISFDLINQKNGSRNNVLTSTAAIDNTKRFNQYIVLSQANLTTANAFGLTDKKAAVSVENKVITDTDIRTGRVLHIVAEKASTTDQSLERAKWEANVRKARSLTYTATVDGITLPDGEPYQFNTLAQVIDVNADINAVMLVKSVAIRVSEGGSTTDFSLVRRDAYTLELEEPQAQKAANSLLPSFNLDNLNG